MACSNELLDMSLDELICRLRKNPSDVLELWDFNTLRRVASRFGLQSMYSTYVLRQGIMYYLQGEEDKLRHVFEEAREARKPQVRMPALQRKRTKINPKMADGKSQWGKLRAIAPKLPNTIEMQLEEAAKRLGKAKVVKQSGKDQVLLIGAGVTLYESLDAAEQLAAENIHCRVLGPFTIKPMNAATIITNAKQCGGRIVTIEDHYPEGGVGEAVMSAVAEERDIIVKKLALPKVPRSGPPKVLLDMFGISAKNIVPAVKEIVHK